MLNLTAIPLTSSRKLKRNSECQKALASWSTSIAHFGILQGVIICACLSEWGSFGRPHRHARSCHRQLEEPRAGTLGQLEFGWWISLRSSRNMCESAGWLCPRRVSSHQCVRMQVHGKSQAIDSHSGLKTFWEYVLSSRASSQAERGDVPICRRESDEFFADWMSTGVNLSFAADPDPAVSSPA